MNILLLPKKITHLLIALLLCCLALPGVSQSVHELTVLKNTTVSFTFDNHSSISINAASVKQQAQNGFVKFNPPYVRVYPNGTVITDDQRGPYGSNPTPNTVEYTPDVDFLGQDYFQIRYRKLVPNSTVPTWGHLNFIVNVVPSEITANNDYATLANGSSITVDVLENDFSNGTNLEIRTVPVTNNGTVELIENNTKIVFTPEVGFSGIADFNYVICDGQGACDGAVVNICVLDGGSSDYETLKIFTKEDTPQVVIAALEGFSVTTAPQNGTVIDTSGVWVYYPNANFDGVDNFTLEGNGFTQEIEMTVLNAPAPNTFVKNDTYFLAIDGEGVFYPLENDLGSAGYSVVALHQVAANGSVSYDASTQSFYYVPNPGFTGLDEFQYRAQPGGSSYFEYGTVRVVVSNQVPANVNYQIVTPIETPMVISYNIPIEDYIYTDWENAVLDYGTLEYYPGGTTQIINNQEVSGYNMLVYTPNAGVQSGTDAFEYQYCAGGDYSDCHLVKINVTIEDVNAPTTDLCVGADCVWTGDTNTDGVVDIRDLLPIGWCMGEVGVERPDADANWYGQHSSDWNAPFSAENFDLKHVDVDGDGIVEAMDTMGISSHYGLHHNPTAEVEGLLISDDGLGWGDGNPLSIQAGDVVLVPFYYGQEATPVLDGYGFTFELPYEPSLFNDVNIHYDDESWMSYNSPILTMNQDAAPGVLHSGYTRTSGVAASGFGPIGQVEFIVIDDFNGIRINNNQIQVSFNPMGEMNGAGQVSASNSSTLTFILNLDGDEEEENELTFIDEDQLKVYPNPTRDQLNVHLNGLGNEVERVVVYSVTGQEVYNSGAIQTKRIELNVSDFATGMYVLKAFTNGGVINKKFEIAK